MSDSYLDDLDALEALENSVESVKETAPEKIVKEVDKTPCYEPGEIPIVNPIEGEGNTREILEFDDLDLALRSQPALFAFYAECAARSQKQYNRAKQNVEQTEARVAYKMRGSWDDKVDGKLTEKALEAKVKISKAVANANECLNDAQYIYRLCNSLVEAFNQREQMIIQSCKRQELELMTKGSFTGKLSREGRDAAIKEAMKKKTTAHD